MATPKLQVELPSAVQCYFEAVAAKSAVAIANCFVRDGLVIDVDRRIEGREAIREWAAQEVIGGVYHIIRAQPAGEQVSVLLTFAPDNSEPFRARYDFEIHEEKIVKVDLQYAY
jgi:hypothetical protein